MQNGKGGTGMDGLAGAQHDVLLIIVTGLFILFATALAAPLSTPITPVIVTTG
jgi:hypothetical protein